MWLLCCSLGCRHAGLTSDQVLAALARSGQGAEAEGIAGLADGAEGLPEEDREALQHFLQQKHNVVNRLDSDEDDEQERGAAAAAPGPSSLKAMEQEGKAGHAGAGRPGLSFRPAVKVKVKAKRPSADTFQQVKRSRAAEQQEQITIARSNGELEEVQPKGQDTAEGGLLGLVGYGSSSGNSGEDSPGPEQAV